MRGRSWRSAPSPARPRPAARELPVASVGLFGDRVHVVTEAATKTAVQVEAIWRAAGMPAVEFRPIAPSLEDVFVSVPGGRGRIGKKATASEGEHPISAERKIRQPPPFPDLPVFSAGWRLCPCFKGPGTGPVLSNGPGERSVIVEDLRDLRSFASIH